MMYWCIGQIQEVLAVEEQVRLRVFMSATVFDIAYKFTYDLENLSLNRDIICDHSLRENCNLHSNAQPYRAIYIG